MKQRAKLDVEALEDRTVLSATLPTGDLSAPLSDAAQYQTAYVNGAMVQMVGWSASPIYSYYGNGIAYVPDAYVVSYKVVNLGNEMSEGTNVVLYGWDFFSEFYGYPPLELAARYVGPLAPGQEFTESFVVTGDSSWAYFGPPGLSMSTYSVWTPTDPLGGAGNLGSILSGGSTPGSVAAPPNFSSGPITSGGNNAIFQNAIPIIAGPAVGGAGGQIADDAVNAVDALGGAAINALQKLQDDSPATPRNPQAGEEFHGLENKPLEKDATDKTVGARDVKQGGQEDDPEQAEIKKDRRDELTEIENQLMRQQPKKPAVPNWLKRVKEEQEQVTPPENDDVPVGADHAEDKDAPPEVKPEVTPPANAPPRAGARQAPPVQNVPVPRPAAQDTVRTPAQPAAPVAQARQPRDTQGAAPQNTLALQRRDHELTQQQAQMAYFILLGSGLASLQRRLKPAKQVEDHDEQTLRPRPLN